MVVARLRCLIAAALHGVSYRWPDVPLHGMELVCMCRRREEMRLVLFLVRIRWLGWVRLQKAGKRMGKALPAWRRRGLLQEPVGSGRKGKWEGQRRGTYFAANNPIRFISVLVARHWFWAVLFWLIRRWLVLHAHLVFRPWGQFLFPKAIYEVSNLFELTSHLCSFLPTSYQLALTTSRSVCFSAKRPRASAKYPGSPCPISSRGA